MAGVDPRFDPLGQGRIAAPNWYTQVPQAQGAGPVPLGQGQGVPDLASANAAAQATQAAIANQSAQAEAAQKKSDYADALSERAELKPKGEKIQRQMDMANAIRRMGSNLNTGSTNGAAPNWAGALANVAGAYFGKKQQDEADAAAAALGSDYRRINKKDFESMPTGQF